MGVLDLLLKTMEERYQATCRKIKWV
jgi:hypothetical protein